MFIKKDLRKVDEILSDESDNREVLKLSKRAFEFQGQIQILFSRPEYVSSSFSNLKVLNLYDNGLIDVNGIGILAQTPLEEINLGCNRLSNLPLEFGSLRTLKSLWLDDNDFQEFPSSICQLRELTALRFSGNSLKSVPSFISSLTNLETLALDNNDIEDFPVGILKLSTLKHLWLRQNKIKALPQDLDLLESLVTLSISSNKLSLINGCICNMASLQFIYANGNQIANVPENLINLPNLQVLHLANNQLTSIPPPWLTVWGQVDDRAGNIVCKDDSGKVKVTVYLLGNPLARETQIEN